MLRCARAGRSAASGILLGIFAFAAGAGAQTFVWDGGGADDLLNNGINWNPDGTPSTGSGVTLQFGGTVRLTPNNNYADWSDFGSILFASGAGAFTLTGNPIDLFGKIENNSANLQTINLSQFSFNNASAELNPVAGDLVINSADIFTNGNTINVWGNNGFTLTVNGVISQGGGLTINQNSAVVLTGANTYTGTTTISAGSLSIGNGGTTGTPGTGGITNNASLILNRSNDFTVANNISGSGSLTKLGAGVATLTGTNSFSGKTALNAGTLSIDADSRLGTAPGSYVADQLSLNGGTLRITGAASVTLATNRGITLGASGGTFDNSTMGTSLNANFNQKITGTGPLALRANGNTSDTGGGVGGNLTLGNTANDFIGDITIHSGVVGFAGDGSFGNAANDIILAGGGLVATDNRSLPSTRSVVLSGGGDRIFRVYGGKTFTINGAITGTGNVRHTDGGTLQLNGSNSFTGNLIAAAGSGDIVALGGVNTFTGYTHLINSSTVRLDVDHAMPDAGAVLMYGGTTFNVNGRTDTLGGLFVGGSGDTTATVNLGGLGSTGTLTIANNAMPGGSPTNVGANFYAKLTGTGAIEYKHATSHTAVWDWLNTTNDFTGNIVITQGRLRSALGTGGVGAFGNADNDIVFNGDIVSTLGNGEGKASLQAAASGALNLGTTRSIILNPGKEGTMYVWGGNTYTVDGQVTGGGNLRKEDGGILLLNNTSNDYTGLTRIAAGTLRIGAAGVIPDASGVEIAGGTFHLNGFNETVASLFGTGGAVNGGSTLTVLTSGSANFAGVLQSNTTLRMAGTGTQTLSGTTDNNSGLARVDSGTLVLAKTSTASVHAVGATNAVGLTIAGGTARLGGTGNDQIYTETLVHQTSGVFDFNGTNEGFRGLTGTAGVVRNDATSTASLLTIGENSTITDTYSYAGAIQTSAGTLALTKVGAGTQQLSGANTYTGATTISGGKLEIAGGGSLSATASVAVNTGGTLLLSGTGGTDTKLNTAAAVTLAGGTLDLSGLSGTLDQTVGALTLSVSSVIDFGTLGAGNMLRFAPSNDAGNWAGLTLSIYNWSAGADHLFFGTDSTALNGAQLPQVSFYSGFNTGFLGTAEFALNGELVPVPEPSTIVAALALLGLTGWRGRRMRYQRQPRLAGVA